MVATCVTLDFVLGMYTDVTWWWNNGIVAINYSKNEIINEVRSILLPTYSTLKLS